MTRIHFSTKQIHNRSLKIPDGHWTTLTALLKVFPESFKTTQTVCMEKKSIRSAIKRFLTGLGNILMLCQYCNMLYLLFFTGFIGGIKVKWNHLLNLPHCSSYSINCLYPPSYYIYLLMIIIKNLGIIIFCDSTYDCSLLRYWLKKYKFPSLCHQIMIEAKLATKQS